MRRLPILGVCLALLAGASQGAGLLVADGGFGGILEIKEHTVDVSINNGIAVTTVNQVFQNTENRQVEALYTFPVPSGASISNFSMWINAKEMVGEVLEKERAREIYNLSQLPDTMRAKAAQLVAESYEEESMEDACTWVDRAIRLQPNNEAYRSFREFILGCPS